MNKNNTFPSLSTEEAEKIVQELGNALDVQRNWTRKFQAMLVCRTKPRATDLNENTHRKTVFGRWYYGNVNPLLRNHSDFTAVGGNSERMHDLARGLATAVSDGADVTPAQYKAFMNSVSRFRVSVRKLLSEAWESLRYTDPLTGVMMRTIMHRRLEEEQERVRRSGQPCSIALMDLDHFKRVNDAHGHQAGDQVLQSIAAYILGHMRRYDQIFRYGGEEFLLLFPNSATSNAKGVLDRLRRGVKRHKIDIGKSKKMSVSASFGLAELHPDHPVRDSIKCADQALYEAKNAGRNRVRVWRREN
ncbi:MAG TPA: diguanylate cyclase [Rhodospirillales bacterium]|nr:diguanylate cyclase [Rhodospirillales bacterium]